MRLVATVAIMPEQRMTAAPVRVAAVTLSPNQKKLMMTENGIAEKPRHEERSMLP